MMEIRRLSTMLICGVLARGSLATTSSAGGAAENGTLSSSSSSSSSLADDRAPVTMMDTGSFHAVVIIRDSMANVVKNWGANGKGQLGLNDTKDRGDNNGDVGDLLPEVYLGTGIQAVDVTAGLRHTAAIMDDGTVRSWGYNRKGQLGVGTSLDVGDEPNEMGDNMSITPLGDVVPVSISAGGWHTCAIVDEDRIKCWGYNQWGELGLGDNDNRGDEPNEMGNNLDFVDLGDDAKVVSLALGDWHTCALVDDGDVKCFGKNYAGQLGLGNTENVGDNDGEMGNSLNSVDFGGRKASAIAAGEEHTCAILEDGSLICWGLNASGQLGQGSTINMGDGDISVSSVPAIELGSGRTAVEITAGGNHTCALLDNDDVKCWGENSYGELGQGDTFERGSSPGQMGDNLLPISLPEGWKLHSLSAGYYHTCGLVTEVGSSDSIVCWGSNVYGQMGLGDSETEHTGDDPDEMGENLQVANLGGDFVSESEGEKWYEKTWFYIACGVVGAVLLCCLCLLCRQAHSDNSGRGPGKPYRGPAAYPSATGASEKSPVVSGTQETPGSAEDVAATAPANGTDATAPSQGGEGGTLGYGASAGPKATAPQAGADQA